MRTIAIGLFLPSFVGLLFSACGTQGSGGSGEAIQCDDSTFAFSNGVAVSCDTCVNQNCCDELVACQEEDDPRCMECAARRRQPNDPPCPELKTTAEALHTCADQHCKYECWPGKFCANGANRPDGSGCMPPEPVGAVTSADCAANFTAVLRGVVDGKPYDQTYKTTSIGFGPEGTMAFGLYLNFWSVADAISGGIDLKWTGVCLDLNTPPVPVTGTVDMPGDGPVHSIAACSGLWQMNDPTMPQQLIYRFNLLLENGEQLTGCARE